MSAGPNRLTEAYKARKRVRDATYRRFHFDAISRRLRARKHENAARLDTFIATQGTFQ